MDEERELYQVINENAQQLQALEKSILELKARLHDLCHQRELADVDIKVTAYRCEIAKKLGDQGLQISACIQEINNLIGTVQI